MANLDDLKGTFFEECADLLQEMEAGLTDMRDGSGDNETVNAVFRSVHSVKGGAGIFGFTTLVEFAHVFETALDTIRRGTLAASPHVVDVLLQAGDILSDMVGMARAGNAVPQGHGEDCRKALKRLTDGGASEVEAAAPAEFEGLDFKPIPVGDADAPAEFDGLDFKPVPAGGSDDANFDGLDFKPVPAGGLADGRNVFRIVFRPKPDMLRNANEPLLILRELRNLGQLELTADTTQLPSLGELKADQAYVAWSGTLTTDAPRAKVEEVFEFVGGDCELEISEVQAAAAVPVELPPVAEAASAPSPPPPAMPTATPTAAVPAAEPPKAAGGGEAGNKDGKGGASAQAAATTIRVDLDRIDRVVNMVGELVIAQAMLGQVVQDIPETMGGRVSRILEEVIYHTRQLKDSVMSMRAQPVRSVFQRMPRLVRELSAKTAKKVQLEMIGEGTEVDKTIIERLSDPLTHIIRNSIDHGIETPADRIAAGKKEEGTIRLSAAQRGGRIVIEVSDDGAGVNAERVLKKARQKGLVAADAQLSDDEITNLIFLPGFSTAEAVSDISGRGVGMDVVRRNIQDLGGRIVVKSERGKGMTIQLALPLTLAVMDGMVVRVGRETYVLPLAAIIECLRPARSDVHATLGTRGTLHLRGKIVPLVHLGELLVVDNAVRELAEGVVIVTEAQEGQRIGLVVDELLGHQQVVIKSIEENYAAVPGIAAATILGNGRVAFILDPEKLADLEAEGPVGVTPSSGAGRDVRALAA